MTQLQAPPTLGAQGTGQQPDEPQTFAYHLDRNGCWVNGPRREQRLFLACGSRPLPGSLQPPQRAPYCTFAHSVSSPAPNREGPHLNSNSWLRMVRLPRQQDCRTRKGKLLSDVGIPVTGQGQARYRAPDAFPHHFVNQPCHCSA